MPFGMLALALLPGVLVHARGFGGTLLLARVPVVSAKSYEITH